MWSFDFYCSNSVSQLLYFTFTKVKYQSSSSNTGLHCFTKEDPIDQVD